ncbi:MAG TPA: potassium channel family protein, partial [Candidatus Limnocylindrales bacterium]|nr:potassium channel family protein [Candidatus Limnocylindrales bacterium]
MADRTGALGTITHAEAALRAKSIPRVVLVWFLVVLLITGVGIAGYVLLGGWSFADALYMTGITLTTVGFREVHPIEPASPVGIWTLLVAMAGVGLIFGTVGIVAESFLAEAVSGRRAHRKMAHRIEQLTGHFILCGYGRVGSTVARELAHSNLDFVVVDINPQSLEQASDEKMLVVEGDATHDDVLLRAGVERAGGLITTTDSDANNVYVTLSARALNKALFIVARANEEGADDKLRQAGADRVVSPYARAGRQIAELATRPRVADFIDFALSHGNLSFSMEEIEVADGGLAGET